MPTLGKDRKESAKIPLPNTAIVTELSSTPKAETSAYLKESSFPPDVVPKMVGSLPIGAKKDLAHKSGIPKKISVAKLIKFPA